MKRKLIEVVDGERKDEYVLFFYSKHDPRVYRVYPKPDKSPAHYYSHLELPRHFQFAWDSLPKYVLHTLEAAK